MCYFRKNLYSCVIPSSSWTFKRFDSISQWSKTTEIRPKNDRISAVLGQILLKQPRINLYESEGTFHGNLRKYIPKLKELDF